MKLNNTKDIRLGAVPMQKLCLGGQTVWERSAPEDHGIPDDLPVIEHLTDYFDCRKGLTKSAWMNQAEAGNNAVIIGGETGEDGCLYLGNEHGKYGYFLSEDVPNRTMYLLWKTDRTGRIGTTIVGLGYSSKKPNTVYTGADRFFRAVVSDGLTDANNHYALQVAADRWSTVFDTGTDIYHVAAITITENGDHPFIRLYIDGVFKASSVSVEKQPYSDFIGIGTVIHSNIVSEDEADGDAAVLPAYNSGEWARYIRHIAVYSSAHSDKEIKAVSEYLLRSHGLL